MNEKKPNQRVPFALLHNGRLIDISQAESGLLPEGVCPSCRGRLVARKGDQKSHHFAHHSVTQCDSGTEAALHLAAKQVILDAVDTEDTLYVPELWPEGVRHRHKVFAYSTRISAAVPEVSISIPSGRRIPDVLASTDKGKLAIEVAVFSFVDEEKREFYEQSGLDCIEINLGHLVEKFADTEATLLLLSDAVLHDKTNRVWINNAAQSQSIIETEVSTVQEIYPYFGQYVISKPSSN